MDEKFTQFFNLVNGKYIEKEDSSNYAQCMDLAFMWCDTLGIPRDTIRHLYAYQVWTNPFDSTRKYFDLIPNGPTNVPAQGDLVVFGQSVGYAGHISIATNKSTAKDLVSLDQNWGSPNYSRLVTHYNYYGVMGWLHPKAPPVAPLTPLEQKIHDIVYSSGDDTTKVAQIQKILPR